MAEYQRVGYIFSDRVEDTAQGVILAISVNPDEPPIELVAPLASPSPVDGALKRGGPGPYHICYEVLSLDAAIEQLEDASMPYVVVSSATPAPLFNGRRVMFIMSPVLGLIELLEA